MNDPNPPSATITLQLSGDPYCTVNGANQPLHLKDALLLGYVAVEGPSTRARLAELLWPDAPAEQGRINLRQRLLRLRRQVGEDLMVGERTLALREGLHCEFRDGTFLGDLAADPDTELAEWLEATRRRMRSSRQQQLLAEADRHETDGRLAEAVACVDRLLAQEPACEPAFQRLMRLHYLRGDRAAAAAAYRHCRETLHNVLGVAPSPQTVQLWSQIESMALAPARPTPTHSKAVPMTVLRPPRLVGRQRELRAALQCWEAQTAFLLLGEAGMGKSRLLAEIALTCECVLVQARPGDGGVPYATLARLLRALIEREPSLIDQAPRGELARVLPEVGPGAALLADGQRLWLQSAVERVTGAARDGGLRAVLVDDLHFADRASLEMLQALADAATAENRPQTLRWGFAQRPAEADATSPPFAALVEHGRLECIALPPLDEDALADLLDSLALPDLDAAQLARQLARHTGGNPLYALETLKHLLAHSADAHRPLPRPPTVGALIERRLRQLSPQALALARVAALAGVDFSIELAEQVLGARALELSDAWTELETAQVLRGSAFAHDLVFETTLASVPATIAQHTHAAIAAFLETRGAAPARLAQHWIDANQPPRALGALHAAAEAARLAMRPREQAQFLLRAADIEAGIDRDAHFESLRGAAGALLMVDRTLLDEALLARLEQAAGRPQQRAVALRMRAEVLLARGEFDPAVQVTEQALALARAAGDEATACELLQIEGGALSLSGNFERAAQVMQAAAPWIEQHGSDASRLSFYGDLAVVLDNIDRHVQAQSYHQRAVQLALAQGEHANAVIVLSNLGVSYSSTGELQLATDALLRAERLMAAHDDARGAGGVVAALLSRCFRDQAQYADALRWGEIGLRELRAQAPGWVAAMHVQMAIAYICLAQFARARQELKQAEAITGLPAWLGAARLLAEARLRRAQGLPGGNVAAQALAIAPQEGRRNLRDLIQLEHALTLAPPDALALAHAVIDSATPRQHQGVVLAARLRAVQFATAAQRTAEALDHAAVALQMAAHFAPEDVYRGELWVHTASAYARAGDQARAQALRAQGADWVRAIAANNVPEPFRDSFLHRNPVNRALLTTTAGR